MKAQANALFTDNGNPFRPSPGLVPRKGSNSTETSLPSLHIREILAPIDFSEDSKLALRHAVSIANQFRATLTMLNVIEPPLVNPETVYPYTGNPDQISRTAEQCLSQILVVSTDWTTQWLSVTGWHMA